MENDSSVNPNIQENDKIKYLSKANNSNKLQCLLPLWKENYEHSIGEKEQALDDRFIILIQFKVP